MLKHFVFFAILLIVSLSTAQALEVGGIKLPDTLKAGDTDLIVNGAGLRKKFGIKVYAIGLYMKAKSSDGNAIIAVDEPMSLCMKYRRSAGKRKIKTVFYESFAKITGAPKAKSYDEKSQYGTISKEVVQFMAAVSKDDTKKNDMFTYTYQPGKGTDVYIDSGSGNKLLVSIPGLEFKKALFAIWIGEEPPVGKKLRKKMLGL